MATQAVIETTGGLGLALQHRFWSSHWAFDLRIHAIKAEQETCQETSKWHKTNESKRMFCERRWMGIRITHPSQCSGSFFYGYLCPLNVASLFSLLFNFFKSLFLTCWSSWYAAKPRASNLIGTNPFRSVGVYFQSVPSPLFSYQQRCFLFLQRKSSWYIDL